MALTRLSYTLSTNNREEIRKKIVMLFLQEDRGNGTGDLSSNYEYIVEQYQNYEIFLRRPASLNWGFDFTVHIRGIWFKNKKRYNNPPHKTIIGILKDYKLQNPLEYQIVLDYINKIFNNENINFNKSLKKFKDYENNEHPIEIILLTIKWLFIEQDITYWNLSGRNMLFNKFINENLF